MKRNFKKPTVIILTVLMLTAVIIPVAVFAATELPENGNDMSSAAAITPGEEYKATMDAKDDVDWYKFTAGDKPAHYVVTLENANISREITFDVCDEDMVPADALAKCSVDYQESGSGSFRAEPGEEYFISVSQVNDYEFEGSTYRLKLTCNEDEAPDEFGEDATEIKVDGDSTVTNSFSIDGYKDVDWYKISGDALSHFVIDVENKNMDSYMQFVLCDEHEGRIDEETDLFSGERYSTSFQPEVGKYYYIGIWAQYENCMGNYGLDITCNLDEAPDEFGEDAIEIKVDGDSTVTNAFSIDGYKDVDWYKISADALSHIVIDVENKNMGSYMQFVLCDEHEGRIDEETDLFSGERYSTSFQPEVGKYYYIGIWAQYENCMGNYGLDITCNLDEAVDEFDAENATEIKTDKWVTTLQMDGYHDVDCFVFTVPESATTDAKVHVKEYSVERIGLQICDELGHEIDDSMEPGETYYILVWDDYNPQIGDYALYIQTKEGEIPEAPAEPEDTDNPDNPNNPEIIIGDVTGDGVVNTGDAVLILRNAAGLVELTESQTKAADTVADGKVNTGDAVAILKYAAGMITEF